MKKPFLFLFIALAFFGCQEVIELELEDPEPELVIEGYITDLDFFIPDGDLVCSPEEVIRKETLDSLAFFARLFDVDSIEAEADYFPYNKVRLTTTAPYFDNEDVPTVSGAVVQLFENDNLVETLQESATEPGIYRITHDPQVGAMYHLRIEALDNIYETLPEEYKSVPPILFTTAEYNENPPFGDSAGYYMGVNTYEPEGPGDYYRWSFYINNKYDSSPFSLAITNDDGIDGSCVPGFDVYGERLELGDTIVIFQMRFGQRHYDFLTNLRQQTAFVGSPFDTPPAPIRGNLKNLTTEKDAFGYFLPAAVSVGRVVVPSENP